jgi:hypothetical protein
VLRRLIVLAGRRAGKDRFFGAVAVWRAALCADWRNCVIGDADVFAAR